MLNVAQLVEFWLVTPEVAGSKPVVQPIIYAALAQLVVRHLAMVEVTSSNLVCRSKYCRLVKWSKTGVSEASIRWFESIIGNYLVVGKLVDPLA